MTVHAQEAAIRKTLAESSANIGVCTDLVDQMVELGADPATTPAVPTLRVGYQPEVLVFLSQGAAPNALAVGSATAVRQEAPVGVLIDDLRQRNGPAWQPTLARFEGSPEALAGEAALQAPRDWKRWLLWALLVISERQSIGHQLPRSPFR